MIFSKFLNFTKKPSTKESNSIKNLYLHFPVSPNPNSNQHHQLNPKPTPKSAINNQPKLFILAFNSH